MWRNYEQKVIRKRKEHLGGEEIAIGIAFEFLQMKVDRKVGNRTGVSESARKDTVGVTVAFS